MEVESRRRLGPTAGRKGTQATRPGMTKCASAT